MLFRFVFVTPSNDAGAVDPLRDRLRNGRLERSIVLLSSHSMNFTFAHRIDAPFSILS